MPRALLSERTVMLSPRVCTYLERRLDLGRLRQAVRGKDAEIDDALLAIRTSAAMWVDDVHDELSASGGLGSAVAPTPEVESESKCLGSSQVADLADCTTRAVTAAAAAGRLRGVKHSETGVWSFDSRDAVAWITTRTETSTR